MSAGVEDRDPFAQHERDFAQLEKDKPRLSAAMRRVLFEMSSTAVALEGLALNEVRTLVAGEMDKVLEALGGQMAKVREAAAQHDARKEGDGG